MYLLARCLVYNETLPERGSSSRPNIDCAYSMCLFRGQNLGFVRYLWAENVLMNG
jgi:hypothetical protein